MVAALDACMAALSICRVQILSCVGIPTIMSVSSGIVISLG